MKNLIAMMTILTSLVFATSVFAEERNELQGEFLMDFVIETTERQTMGDRIVVPIVGGYFKGPNLNGEVLDVGADWAKRRDDGVSELDVRVTLKTDDDALIYMSYQGILHRSDSGMYWRVVPTFETGSEKYAYLEKLLAVGIGKQIDGKTAYSIYKVK